MLTEGIFISIYSRVIIRQHLKSSTSLSQTPYTPNKTHDTITYSFDEHLLSASGVLCIVTWAWDTQASQKASAAFCGTMLHSYNLSPLIKIHLTNPTSNFDFHPICLANLQQCFLLGGMINQDCTKQSFISKKFPSPVSLAFPSPT